MDPTYWTLLPQRKESVGAKEAAALMLVFAEGGDTEVELIVQRHQKKKAPSRSLRLGRSVQAPAVASIAAGPALLVQLPEVRRVLVVV